MLECNEGHLNWSTGFEVLESALKLTGMSHIAQEVHPEALKKCLKSSQEQSEIYMRCFQR